MLSTTRLLWTLAVVALLAPGCGDDDSPADDGGTDDIAADADADADSDGDADAEAEATEDDGGMPGTLTVLVSFVDWPGDPVPASGVVVAFDPPAGTRSEAPTGTDGRVTFDVADWSAGTAAVTAYAEGRQMVSRVGITEADGEVELRLDRLGDPEDFVTLSGTLTGMAHPDWSIAVTATVPNIYYGSNDVDLGLDWEIKLAPDSPCTIVANSRTATFSSTGRGFVQDMQWAMVEQPGVGVDTVVPIDFTTDQELPSTTSGSFTLPARADSPLHGPESYGWPSVQAAETRGTGILGIGHRVDINADATAIDYEVEYVQPAGVTPITCFFLTADGDGRSEQTSACEPGWAPTGAHDPGFLDAPRIIAPAASGRPLAEPMIWELFDSEVHVAVMLVPSLGSRWIWPGPWGATTLETPWIVMAADDATTITVPELPSTATMEDLFGSGSIVGAYVQIWRDSAPGAWDYAKVALSHTFVVSR